MLVFKFGQVLNRAGRTAISLIAKSPNTRQANLAAARCQMKVGHLAARLDQVRIVQPRGEVGRRVLQPTRRQCFAAGNVREVRPDAGMCRGSANGVATGAAHLLKILRAPRRRPRRRNRRSALLISLPLCKVRRRLRDDPDAHPGMFFSAIFRAATVVNARSVRGEPAVVFDARDDVDLAAEFRNPEIVNYIRRTETDILRLIRRDVDLIGGYDSRIRIMNFPPPLVGYDQHVDRPVRGRIGRFHRANREHRNYPENDDKTDRIAEFELDIAVHGLRRGLSGLLAESVRAVCN